MKQLLLVLANGLSLPWRLLPERLRALVITGLFVLESRQREPAIGLSRLFLLRDRLDLVINERAMALGNGEHPKHRLTEYHKYFIDHINNGDRVLDIGCGYGAVARSIASACPESFVIGIDINSDRLAEAQRANNPKNLSFSAGDATKQVPQGKWDVIVLSNVLEHIDDRCSFLRALSIATGAPRFLIRVPLFERDWQMAMRRELGVDFRSDPDHRVEHTLDQFLEEINAGGLYPEDITLRWGEIWADCKVMKP